MASPNISTWTENVSIESFNHTAKDKPLRVTLAPVSIKYRLHLQELWCRGVEWDQALDDSDKDLWHAHLTEMKELVKCQMPRCVKPEDAGGKPQMHCFSDGGARGYGAVLWL